MLKLVPTREYVFNLHAIYATHHNIYRPLDVKRVLITLLCFHACLAPIVVVTQLRRHLLLLRPRHVLLRGNQLYMIVGHRHLVYLCVSVAVNGQLVMQSCIM